MDAPEEIRNAEETKKISTEPSAAASMTLRRSADVRGAVRTLGGTADAPGYTGKTPPPDGKILQKSFRGLVEVKYISGGGRDNSRPHACINAATT